MQRKRHLQRRGSGLARVIVRRRANAAEAEDQVATCEGFAQHRGEACAMVGKILRERKRETARSERCDDVTEMLILPLAGQDLIADDQCTERDGIGAKSAQAASVSSANFS